MNLGRRSRFKKEAVELNITAFMNLMVILVPFLLITAVFSRLTVIELNLPPQDSELDPQTEEEIHLEVVVRKDAFDIQTNKDHLIKRFERSEEKTDWNEFSKIMIELKKSYPDKSGITLLLEKEIDYKTMIKVMDRVRSAQVVDVTTLEDVDLFADISIGDAPVKETEGES